MNASTKSRSVAMGLQRQGIPSVCLVLPDVPAVFRHKGLCFVACLASRRRRDGRKIQCISCGGGLDIPLCAKADRPFLVTLPAYGPRAAAAAAHCLADRHICETRCNRTGLT